MRNLGPMLLAPVKPALILKQCLWRIYHVTCHHKMSLQITTRIIRIRFQTNISTYTLDLNIGVKVHPYIKPYHREYLNHTFIFQYHLINYVIMWCLALVNRRHSFNVAILFYATKIDYTIENAGTNKRGSIEFELKLHLLQISNIATTVQPVIDKLVTHNTSQELCT